MSPFLVACQDTSVAQTPAELLPTPRAQPPMWKLTGVASCGSSGCHGAAHPTAIEGSEYNVWITADPHSRAYTTLFNEQSWQMSRLLNQDDSSQPIPPYEDNRCLACHSMTHAEAVRADHDVLTDGVSCEACHGPAEAWLAEHYTDGFQQLSAQQRESEFGFWNTKSLVRRSQICASCHVGSPGRDVNHDLIAAGHPRLQFEMGAYSATMPLHWSDAKDRQPWGDEFDAILWAVGQVCTSQAALNQLTARASSKGPWPEFAEWSCAACHHDLRDNQQRQQHLAQEDGLSGKQISWDDWNHHGTRNYLGDLTVALEGDRTLASALSRNFNSLEQHMRSITANRNNVAQRSQQVANQLNEFAYRLESSKWTKQTINSLSRRVTNRHIKDGVRRWSTAAQVYDALASLQQSRLNGGVVGAKQISIPLSALYRGLVERELSPNDYRFDTAQVAGQLLEVRRALPAVEDN